MKTHIPRRCIRFAQTLDIRFLFRWSYWLDVQLPPCQRISATVQSPLARRALPLHNRYYGLMCGSFDLHSILLLAYRNGPCRLGHPRLVRRAFPALSRCSFLKCCVPYPGSLSSAPVRYFLDNIGLASCLLCSADSHTTANGSRGESLSGRQTFRYVAALQFVCPPGHSHR